MRGKYPLQELIALPSEDFSGVIRHFLHDTVGRYGQLKMCLTTIQRNRERMDSRDVDELLQHAINICGAEQERAQNLLIAAVDREAPSSD